jgi:hypothetical protein
MTLRRLAVSLLFLVALAAPANTQVFPRYVPLGYQQITSLSSAAGLAIPTGATAALVAVEGAAVRYRDDGSAPTATVGMPLAVGQTFFYSGTLSRIQFIEQSASASVSVSYYR